MNDAIEYRIRQARELPIETGVYALCDLDEVPIYVGQSTDGIRARVRRHLTSARSDVIANRQLDVWEIAFVWAWPVAEKRIVDNTKVKKITEQEILQIKQIERVLYHAFDKKCPLVNGTVHLRPSKAEIRAVKITPTKKIQVMTDDEIKARKNPSRRLPRQAEHFRSLLDHMLNVKNAEELRRALKSHFIRLEKYYRDFLASTHNINTGGSSGDAD